MRHYIMTTGIVFGLLTLAHAARIIVEGWQVASSVIFVLATIVPAALCIWAFYLLRQSRRNHS